MKIAIDARLYGLENAGIGRYSMEFLSELARQDLDNQYYILLRSNYFNSLKLPENFIKIEADIPHYSIAEQRRIPKILKKINPDLVHFLHFNVPLSYKGKFVVTIHDSIMHSSKGKNTSKQPFYKYYLKRIAYKKVFAHAIKKSEKIIVPSNYVKKQVGDKFRISGSKIVVCYEGVNKDFTKQNKQKTVKNKQKYLIYTGSAYPHKNLQLAVEAIVQLNESSQEKVNFKIVGAKNKFMSDLETFVDKFGAADTVKFLGFIKDDKLNKLYGNAVGFIYPSIEEGFGLPGLEAMSSGTIVVASNIPVFKEIYDGAAVFFDPTERQSIVEALNKTVAMTTDERNRLLALSQKTAAKYSWAEMTIKIRNVYNAI